MARDPRDRAVIERAARRWTLFHDEFMRVVFRAHPELVEELLRRVIGKLDLVLKKLTVQDDRKQIGSRSAVFDVLAVDGDGKPYDIEIQNRSDGASPQRARFHCAVLDSRLLKPKQNPATMVEAFVIFITAEDVVGRNQPVYWFDRVSVREGIPFGDGSHIVYVNGAWSGDDPVGELVHDMKCVAASKMKIKMFAKVLKNNRKRGGGMSEIGQELVDYGIQKGRKKGVSEGRKQGELKRALESAKRFIEMGVLALEQIAQGTGLTIEDVRKLQAQMG